MCVRWGTPRPVVPEGKVAKEGVSSATRLRGPAAQIATNSSPVSAVPLRARVAVTCASSGNPLERTGLTVLCALAKLAWSYMGHSGVTKHPNKRVERASFVAVSKNDRIRNGDVPRPHPAPQQTLRRDRVRQGGIKAYPEGCILGATSAGRTVFRSHGSQPARPRADEDLAQMTNHFVRVRTEQIWPNWRKVGRGSDATREKGVRFRADIFGSHSWKDRDPH